MATPPPQTHVSDRSPLNLSFDIDTDFTVLADYCERFADSLMFRLGEGQHGGKYYSPRLEPGAHR